MDELVHFVKETAEMPEPTVGITTSPIPPGMKTMIVKTKLSDLDYKILRALKDDSRKATSDIAQYKSVSQPKPSATDSPT